MLAAPQARRHRPAARPASRASYRPARRPDGPGAGQASRPVTVERADQLERAGGAADEDPVLAGGDDPAVAAPAAERAERARRCRRVPVAPGVDVHAIERRELADRPRRVVARRLDVDLDDFAASPIAGVRHIDRHGHATTPSARRRRRPARSSSSCSRARDRTGTAARRRCGRTSGARSSSPSP